MNQEMFSTDFATAINAIYSDVCSAFEPDAARELRDHFDMAGFVINPYWSMEQALYGEVAEIMWTRCLSAHAASVILASGKRVKPEWERNLVALANSSRQVDMAITLTHR